MSGEASAVLDKLNSIDTKMGSIQFAHEENSKKIEEYQKTIESLTVRLEHSEKRTEELEDLFRRSLAERYGSTRTAVPKDDWSWARFAYAKATNDWDAAPFERKKVEEFRNQVRQRAVAQEASDFSSGGVFVPTQYINELIGLLRPTLMTDQLGVTTLTGLTGSPVSWPKITGGSTAYWIAPERTPITPSKVSTGQLELQPRKCAALVKISNDLVLLSNPSVEAVVRADMIATLQQAVDLAFFQGLGAQGQPRGINNWTPAIPTADITWATDDLQRLNALKSAIEKVATADALRGNLSFATNIKSWFAIDRLVDVNKRPYMQYDPANTQVGGILRGTIAGFPVRGGTNVSPSGTDVVYYGNWSDALLAIWSAMEITSSTEADTAFTSDELWIRAILRVDVGFRREVSFAKVASVA